MNKNLLKKYKLKFLKSKDTFEHFIMNEAVVLSYSIKFESKIIDFGLFNKVLYKIIETNNSHLSTYLNEFEFTAEQLDEEVLPIINAAIAFPNVEQELDSVTYGALLVNNIIDLYYDGRGVVFSLPIKDLKEILEGFREYLNKPPFSA